MYLNLFKRKILLIDFVMAASLVGVLFTLTISALNANSICIIILCASVLAKGDVLGSFRNAWSQPFFRACCLYYLVFVAGIFYADSFKEGFKSVEMRTALVAIPFIFCSKRITEILRWERIMMVFTLILVLVSLYCLAIALYHVAQTNETHFLFYHDLVSPISQHAVYFSILLFISVIFLIEQRNNRNLFKELIFCYLLIAYFIFIITLLASKLILILLFLFLVYKLFKEMKRQMVWYVLVALILPVAFLMVIDNPVKKRFVDILTVRTAKIDAPDLRAEYFNGVEFRLLQWKLVTEILNDKKAWIVGVSPANAQHELDDKYSQHHFYLGDPSRGDHGFLGYNAHNQFLQSLLQSGWIGLIVFIYLCYTLIRLSIKTRLPELWMTTLILIAFCFTESVLQTHAGLVSFTFFPLLIYYSNRLKPV